MIIEKNVTRTYKTGEIENFLTLHDVRDILRYSTVRVLDLVREGDIPAYNGSGRPLDLESLDRDTRGLRFLPSDLQKYIDSLRLY